MNILPRSSFALTAGSWRPSEEFHLRTRYGRTSVAAIARELGRKEQSVRSKAMALGLRRKPAWTEAQNEFLRDHRGEFTCGQLGELLGHTALGVRQQAHRLGLALMEPRPWTPEEIALLEARYPELTARELGELLGRTESQVWNKASSLSLRKRPALSAEAEAVLWELRGVEGAVEWFAKEYKVGLAAVRSHMKELERVGGPTRPVGNLPKVLKN